MTFPHIDFTVTPRTKAFKFWAVADIVWKNPFGVDLEPHVQDRPEAGTRRRQTVRDQPACDLRYQGRGKPGDRWQAVRYQCDGGASTNYGTGKYDWTLGGTLKVGGVQFILGASENQGQKALLQLGSRR